MSKTNQILIYNYNNKKKNKYFNKMKSQMNKQILYKKQNSQMKLDENHQRKKML